MGLLIIVTIRKARLHTYVSEASEYINFFHHLLQFILVFNLRENCFTSDLSAGLGIESEMNRSKTAAITGLFSRYTWCYQNGTYLPKQ